MSSGTENKYLTLPKPEFPQICYNKTKQKDWSLSVPVTYLEVKSQGCMFQL